MWDPNLDLQELTLGLNPHPTQTFDHRLTCGQELLFAPTRAPIEQKFNDLGDFNAFTLVFNLMFIFLQYIRKLGCFTSDDNNYLLLKRHNLRRTDLG